VELKPYSGERICGGIAVIDENRAVTVAPVDGLSRLRCVYGDGVAVLELARTVALESLEQHLARVGTSGLERWTPPVEGVALGPPLVTASSSVREQLRSALLEYSSLAGVVDEAEIEITTADQRSAASSAARLLSAIQKAVAAVQPGRLARFNQSYRVREDARPLKLGYVGPNIVANFAAVFPQQLAARVNLSKAKLWDLAQARVGARRGWFTDAQPAHYELLVHRPTEGNVEYSQRQLAKVAEALAELDAEADRVEIRCRPLTSAEAIAQHLLAVDA